MDLTGKVALITGAARGQGQAEAQLFAELGASVVACDVLADRVAATATEIGGKTRHCRLDVRSEQDWDDAVALAVDAFGRLDILVNNAGIYEAMPLLDATVEHFRRVVAVDQEGVFLGMRAAARAMVRTGGGSIVNIGSVASFHPFEGATAYAASKAAVAAMSKAAAMELGPQGIRVNVVHPGGILTEMSTPTGEISPFYARLALGRIGEPIELARMVAFLASDDSSYCTGAEFVVDGGWTTGRYSREMTMK